MRRFLLALFILTVSLPLSADNRTWVVLTLADGSEQSFVIPDRMTITWDKDSLYISSSLIEASYYRPLVKGYSFRQPESEPDGIDLPMVNAGYTVVWESANSVAVYGVADGATANVYATNAVRQAVTVTRSSDALRIDLSSLPSGIFIVSVSGIPSFKVKR